MRKKHTKKKECSKAKTKKVLETSHHRLCDIYEK